jgi:transposase
MPGPLPQYPIALTEEQVEALTRISACYTCRYGDVLRARILLLAHHHPTLNNSEIARRLGCSRDTVQHWRKRFRQDLPLAGIADRHRSGASRRYPALVRAQVVALACSKPADHGKPYQLWTGARLAEVAVEKGITQSISRSTINTWLRQDKIKPWRYHSWQKSTDPLFVERAVPVLDLYETAAERSAAGEVTVCVDEKTSIQARQPVNETEPAAPGHVVHVADRYKRMGALQLFCALAVATGATFARCLDRKRFVEFKAFLQELFGSTLCQGITRLNLILDNGPTHAPKQLGPWIASLELSFTVQIFWLPKYASWLDQVEIIFSKVQRAVLTPCDFASKLALERKLTSYFDGLNALRNSADRGHPERSIVDTQFGPSWTPRTVQRGHFRRCAEQSVHDPNSVSTIRIWRSRCERVSARRRWKSRMGQPTLRCIPVHRRARCPEKGSPCESSATRFAFTSTPSSVTGRSPRA